MTKLSYQKYDFQHLKTVIIIKKRKKRKRWQQLVRIREIRWHLKPFNKSGPARDHWRSSSRPDPERRFPPTSSLRSRSGHGQYYKHNNIYYLTAKLINNWWENIIKCHKIWTILICKLHINLFLEPQKCTS